MTKQNSSASTRSSIKRRKPYPKQHYSFIPILTGSDLSKRRLALMQAESGRPGPIVWLTACMHGDEIGSIVVVQELFKRLKKTPLKKGRLGAFPLVNPIGFESGTRTIPFSKEDLNRNFPGDPNGSLAERLAHKIFSVITEHPPALVLDLHNDWRRSLPYALIDPCEPPDLHSRCIDFARQTGLIIIQEDGYYNPEGSLTGSLIRLGIPAVTLELGESDFVNETDVKQGVASILRVLSFLGMVSPGDLSEMSCALPGAEGSILHYSHAPRSTSSGIIRFLVSPGSTVKSGQKVARIYNPFGKVHETLLALQDAIVLGLTDSSAAFPGGPVMAFGCFEPVAKT